MSRLLKKESRQNLLFLIKLKFILEQLIGLWVVSAAAEATHNFLDQSLDKLNYKTTKPFLFTREL